MEKSQVEINSKDRRTFKNITTTVWQNAMPELSKSNITIMQSEILLWNSGVRTNADIVAAILRSR